MFRPNLPWAYTNCLGDVFSYGMYYWDLKSSLDKPPASYLIDSFTVAKKPTVLYETNIGRPNPFRAEYPIKLAALASYQDWDGVFWHYWKHVESGPGDLGYLNEKLLPPMPNFLLERRGASNRPRHRFVLGLGRSDFPRWVYSTCRSSQSLQDRGEAALFLRLIPRDQHLSIDLQSGSEIQFAPEDTTTKNDDLIPVATRLQHAVASGKYLTWDWPNGRLIIDAPNVKAYVGKIEGFFRFSDGITLGNVNAPWVAFVLESADGKPLLGSQTPAKMLMGAVADAKNTGFAFDYNVVGGPSEQAKAVRNLGNLPVLVDKVEYSVWFPHEIQGNTQDL